MQKQILQELKELRTLFTRLAGTADLPEAEQFSGEAIARAADQFQKMRMQRGEWISENEISKIIRNAGWRSGKFIREEFGFNACIKNGHYYLYHKKTLQRLANELKDRNINLSRYIDYKEDRANFQKKLATLKKSNKGKRPYSLPSGLKDIQTSPIPAPSVELIRADLASLKQEFFEQKLGDYIDMYSGNHAMLKFIYHFEKYLEPGLKRRCSKWCDSFNYANHALELITKKKEKFVPVKEEDMIQL